MSNPPRLNVSGIPGPSADESAATASPARGKEMRANLLSKLRPPPLVHAWDFWHDRQNRGNNNPSTQDPSPNESKESALAREQTIVPGRYEDRLVKLASVADVRGFWEVFNNFDTSNLPLRDSVHLFHRGVKPVWEDPRNDRGGSWTFRVPKEKAQDFWKEICMLAIGEQLQAAVSSKRVTFVDDICGMSLSVRFTSILVQIWNRDSQHEEGIQNILATVCTNLSPELKPKDSSSYYYKAHREHAAFNSAAPPSDKDDFPHATVNSIPESQVEHEPHAQRGTDGQEFQRPEAAGGMQDHTNADMKDTRDWPTFPRARQAGLMKPVDDRQAQEAQSGMAPPGGSSGGPEAAVPKGSGFISQEEAVQDVKDTLGSMKEAMYKIAQKDEAIQRDEGSSLDKEMSDAETFAGNALGRN